MMMIKLEFSKATFRHSTFFRYFSEFCFIRNTVSSSDDVLSGGEDEFIMVFVLETGSQEGKKSGTALGMNFSELRTTLPLLLKLTKCRSLSNLRIWFTFFLSTLEVG